MSTRLGDLEHELAGGEAGLGEDRRDVVDEVRRRWSWRGREVDVTATAPAAADRAARRACAARLAQHPAAERHDQPALLGERDELVRRDDAARRVLPAHERLDADELAGREVDDRLVVARQLAARRCRGAARPRARAARRSPRASSARRPRSGSCPRPWPGTSRGRRCAAGRRPARAGHGAAAMPMLALIETSWPRSERDLQRLEDALGTPIGDRLGPATSSSRMANSSPPRRATRVAGRGRSSGRGRQPRPADGRRRRGPCCRSRP